MSDYDKYFQELAKQASNNTLSSLGGIATQLSPATVQYAGQPGADVGEAILASSILGLLGGGLGQLGQNQASRDLGLASKVLLGQSTERDPNLSPSLYRSAQNYKDLVEANRAQALSDKVAEKELDILGQYRKDINKKNLDINYLDDQMIAEEAALQKLSGSPGGSTVGQPGILTKKGQALKDLEDTFYKRITNIPSYSTFSDINDNFKTLIQLSDLDSRPASVGMISSLARIWDPAGTVREGEYRLNANAQAALDNVVGDWREIVLGKGKLGADGKKAILDAAGAKYNEFGKVFSKARDVQYEALKRQGGDPANIPSLEYTPWESTTPKTTIPPEAYLEEARRRGLIK